MAKVKNPDLAKIDRLGPDIDFYYWKGIPVVRKMPKKFKPIGTEAQKATWAAMKYAHDQYQALPVFEREAYKVLTAKSQMCNRDFVTKLCLKNYPDLGEKYSSWRVSFEPQGGGITKVFVSKAFPSDDIVSCMTYNETVSLLQWLEINPNLRGKKFRRRWDLKESIEKAHRVENKEAFGIKVNLIENDTSIDYGRNSVLSGDFAFYTRYGYGLFVYNISGGVFSFVASAYPGKVLSNVAKRGDYLFVVSHQGGLYCYLFTGSSLLARGSISLSYYFNDVVVDDDYIYTAERNDGIGIYTHNGSSFSLVTRENTGGLCLSVYVVGSLVVASNVNGAVFLYRFDGTSLTLLDTIGVSINSLRMSGFENYIAVCTYDYTVEIFKIVNDKFESVTSSSVRALINNIRFSGPYIFCSNASYGPTILKLHNDTLFEVFEQNTGLYCQGIGYDDTRFLIPDLTNGAFLYEYISVPGFGYNFEAVQADGDEFLCIKSDPNDSSSFGLSGLYAIPY